LTLALKKSLIESDIFVIGVVNFVYKIYQVEGTMSETPIQSEAQGTGAVTPKTAPPAVHTEVKDTRHMRPEVLSFVSLFLLGISVLFFTLWFTEMQKTEVMSPVVMDESEQTEEVAALQYVMPEMLPSVGTVELPKPEMLKGMPVEEAIAIRRSKRAYTQDAISIADLSQMLWAGQGQTDESGHRAAPSGRGTYPHTLYAVVRNVEGVEPGLYRYEPATHSLSDMGVADAGDKLNAAKVQDNSQNAPVVIVLSTAYAKSEAKFPDSAEMNADLEAGHIGQNLYLQAESLGLGTVVTGGFSSDSVVSELGLDPNESVTYLIPFGHPAAEVEAVH